MIANDKESIFLDGQEDMAAGNTHVLQPDIVRRLAPDDDAGLGDRDRVPVIAEFEARQHGLGGSWCRHDFQWRVFLVTLGQRRAVLVGGPA